MKRETEKWLRLCGRGPHAWQPAREILAELKRLRADNRKLRKALLQFDTGFLRPDAVAELKRLRRVALAAGLWLSVQENTAAGMGASIDADADLKAALRETLAKGGKR